MYCLKLSYLIRQQFDDSEEFQEDGYWLKRSLILHDVALTNSLLPYN
eukprot:CAMPEP_0184666282 /NCGR_PEP_ID=MMETSP0308-20130426/60755_1 /TAXON_ID=38269 /ORGANISM="Gloeochaete witrockiana, Strain SAG 46.84" /LENGTH=46 /DNA_ID= /DNA_START= /DNA_END= /DNA_ORIENTATION=